MFLVGIIWLAGCFTAGIWADKKGRSGGGWFLFSLFLSPLIALAIVASLDAKNKKKCPKCAEAVKIEAITCKHCSHSFEAEMLQNNYELLAKNEAYQAMRKAKLAQEQIEETNRNKSS